MKNILIIDVDTTRDKVMMFKKPNDLPLPQNKEEAKKMILEDVSCAFEAFCSLVMVIDQNGYGKKEDMLKTSIEHLNDLLSK
jgi:hypothetical protein